MRLKKPSNRFFFQLHGWFSLPVWILFCFICVTGTLAVVSHEITWLVNPDARASNPDERDALPAYTLVERVQQSYPTADITGLSFQEPYMAASVMFTDSDKPYAVAYVNQYTGDIQQVHDGNTFSNFMRTLHGWLYFPWSHGYSVGYYLVGAMSLVTLGAVFTGMIVYKKFWRAWFAPKIRFSQGGRTLIADLHKVAGAWSIWFMLIMGLTGLYYLIQGILWHNDVEIDPYPDSMAVSVLPASQLASPGYTLKDAIERADARFESFTPSYIMLPEHNRDSIKLSGYGDEIFFDHYSYNLALNPWGGDVIQSYQPASMGGLQTLSHLIDPLHYGYIGGLATKLLWFVFGLVLSAMSVTGFLMWSKRVRRAVRQPRQEYRTHHVSEVS